MGALIFLLFWGGLIAYVIKGGIEYRRYYRRKHGVRLPLLGDSTSLADGFRVGLLWPFLRNNPEVVNPAPCQHSWHH